MKRIEQDCAPRRIPILVATLAGAAIASLSTATLAGTAWSGTLSGIHFFDQGTVLVSTSGSRSGVPTCATTQSSRFAIDTTTAGGRSQLAGLLAAYTTGRNVIIVGNGTCNVYSDSETIQYFYTVD